MSKIVALSGQERNEVGKGAARALRRANYVPVIIYGGGKSEVMLSLPNKEMTKLYLAHGFFSHLYEIEAGKKKYRVLAKHVQLNPVSDKIEHIDFIHVDAGSKIKIPVELEFVNKDKSEGIKKGGILSAAHMHIDLLCDPAHIPEMIEVDVLNLEIGDVVHAGDLKLPKNVELSVAENYTVCTILAANMPAEEEITAEVEAVEGEEVADSENTESASESKPEEESK